MFADHIEIDAGVAFYDQFVMDMTDDKAVPECFHGIAEDIAADRLHDILHEFRTVGFDTFPFLCGTDALIGHGFTAELILSDTGLHIAEHPAGGEIMVLFDEFDKTFARGGKDEDPQVTMLSLFDGVSPRKKLFVVTCNELRNLNSFMVNRPGRFHYHLRFDYPGAKDIQEYLSDVLEDEYKVEIDSVIEFSNRIGLNYDCLRSIAFELNQGLSFADAIKDINIVNVEREPYSLKIFFEDGTVYLNNKFYMDSFSEDEIEVELHEKRGGYGGDVYFLP